MPPTPTQTLDQIFAPQQPTSPQVDTSSAGSSLTKPTQSLEDIFGKPDSQKPSLDSIFNPNPTVDTSFLGKQRELPGGGTGSIKDSIGGKVIGSTIDAFKGAFSGANEDFNKNIDQIISGSKDETGLVHPIKLATGILTGTGKSVADIAGRSAEAVFGTIGNIISSFIPQNVKDNYKDATEEAIKGIQEAWNAPTGSPEADKGKEMVHNALGSILTLAQNNPEVAKEVVNGINLVLSGVGAEDIIPSIKDWMAKVISGTAKTVKESGITSAISETASNLTSKSAPTVEQSLAESQKILNPSGKYTVAERQAAYQKGNITTEGIGPFKKEVVTPQATKQTALIDELAQQGKVSSKNLPSQNIEALSREAKIADSGIDEVVNRPELNKPFTGQQIQKDVYNKVLNSAKENLTFVSGTTEEKAYTEVVNLAKQEIAKFPQNSSGLRQAIKSFNAKMERILGADIYSGAEESVGNARLQAAKDMRTALNDFLADNLESPTITKSSFADQKVVNTLPAKSSFEYGKVEGGNIYKAQLQREAMLLNARDEIAFRARTMVDKTKLALFLQKHPLVKKAVFYGLAGIAGGEVLKELGM